MRRKCRKKSQKVDKFQNTVGAQKDITLKEYADSSKSLKQGTIRVKKSAVTVSKAQIQDIHKDCQSKMQEDEASWFDKDIEDFDIENDVSVENTAKEDVEEEKECFHQRRRKHRKGKCSQENEGRVAYPIDLWFSLAGYIQPEAVGKFAMLCRDTYSITRTRQFWKNLYLRYCMGNKELPDHLKEECLEQAQGLRCRVIRALFWSYTPFIERITTNIPFENEPYHLKGTRCMFTWCEPFKNVWNFSLKLRKERLCDLNKLTTLKSLPKNINLYKGYCDVYGNEENDCYVLQVTCQHFQNQASVMGLVLSNIYLKVSQENRYHCLRLHFDTVMKESTNQNRDRIGDTVISLDRVLNLKVFPWWHQKYPFQSSV